MTLPADHAYVQASRAARGRRRLTHVARRVMPHGFVERRALCGAEPTSGLVEVMLASCDRVCERCERRASS